MNYHSLLGGIFDWFLGIFDNIPRLIYFLFAALSSGVDALQCLIRKLAGLDVYYVKVDNGSVEENSSFWGDAWQAGHTVKKNQEFVPIRNRDPLSEFIYGILGVGENKAAYSALNTVFWSLSIFAIILLALATIVAIIKSHYSEDYNNTNPWKYIYTAIKCVLTYAIMPVVVVFGITLSSFILTTLDNITAGNGEEKLRAIYGSKALQNAFQYDEETKDSTGKKVYAGYDFFGLGLATTSTTWGGMLFQAAAYNCNRLRMGQINITEVSRIQSNNTQIFGANDSSEYSKYTNTNDKIEYMAYQIDYAFMNNITVQKSISLSEISGNLDGNVRNASVMIGGQRPLSSFSKYNVGAVWFFYDLWNFQFIVAFGGAVSCLGVLVSIILGLMSRLIRGAALFLLYPPLLALGPLDNFKAFKSWGTEFMKDLLMAYGAIIGMNILMLILPTVQNIHWFGTGFGWGIIDAIINMIILITGICMAKTFISTVSQFIGGGDAAGVGEGLKGSVQGAIKAGSTKAIGLGANAVKFGVGAVKTGVAGVKALRNRVAIGKAKKSKGRDLADEEAKKSIAGLNFADLSEKSDEELKGLNARQKAGLEAYKAARADGKSDEEARKAAESGVIENMKKTKTNTRDEKGNYLSEFDLIRKQQNDQNQKDLNEAQTSLDSAQEKLDGLKKRKKNGENISDDDMKRAQAEVDGAKDWVNYQKTIKKADQNRQKLTDFTEDAKNGKLKGYQLDKNGNIVSNLKQAFTKEGAAQNFSTLTQAIGKGLDQAFDFKKGGKEMADAFLKSMKSLADSTGIDKMIAGLKPMLNQGMTLKGGVFNPVREGDALSRANAKAAEEQSRREVEAAKETNALLKQLIQKTDTQIASNKDIKTAIEKGGMGKTYGKKWD